MKTITVVANIHKERAVEEAKNIIALLSEKNCTVYTDEGLARTLGIRTGSAEEIWQKTDLVIALGGDGTFLKFSKYVSKKEIPILGINLGGLGFLTEFSLEEFYGRVDEIIQGNFSLEKRMMLEVEFENTGAANGNYTALNDVVLSKGDIARMIHVHVEIDKKYLTSYSCDGLIIATPTGSTAHSLSAGGPILVPETESFILTPICPHTISNRPLVISANSTVQLKLERFESDTQLTIDGQVNIPLEKESIIRIKKSASSVMLVNSGNSFFEILRKKLNWKGSHVLCE